jgi:D-3-phosphoglycerate dehydrogenase / 2-oxoglutarate reductase
VPAWNALDRARGEPYHRAVQNLTVAVLDHPFADLATERRILGAVGATVIDARVRTEAECLAACRRADAVLLRRYPLPRAVIGAMERCRIICNYGAGYDNVDVAAATERGIMVANTRGYGDEEVADHTLMLLLALARRLAPQLRALDAAATGDAPVAWSHTPYTPIRRLSGQVLGIVGFGRIGQCLAQKALGIGLRVVAADPLVPAGVAAGKGVALLPLMEMLAQADFVSIHTPLSAGTRHLIGAAEFARMKTSAYLINCARGAIVDQQALLRALQSGRLAGAALDVLDEEPPSPALLRELLASPMVLVTPHLAWYSEESVADRQRLAAETVAQALQGHRPACVVNE